MNKKGFTLIELLAIIVILAIIAVITVPIILNIIDEAKGGANKNSVIGYGKAVELAYTQYMYEEQLGSGTNSHVASSAEVTASNTAGDGRVISITIDNNNSINLKVDYDGDNVVCTPTGTDVNSIISGVVSLKGCSVNGSDTTYDYSGGKAQ
jgi:type IV pilus assembly protein PilA